MARRGSVRRPVRHRRLAAQLIARPADTPGEVVARLGAVQAQDYLASLWAVGLRLRRATDATIEDAIADGTIVRTHAYRGTLQYLARDDVRWMVGLVAPRVIAGAAARYRRLGLDDRTLQRANTVLREATRQAQLTRSEIAAALRRARIATDGERLIHIILRAELDLVLCSGARRGKQTTFAAFDERIPAASKRPRDAAVAELARRFFTSRGPATLRDFVWWTGLSITESRAGLEAIAGELDCEAIDGRDYWSARGGSSKAAPATLLPAYDEYLVGYQDRRDAIAPEHASAVDAGFALLAPGVMVDGHIIGGWRRSLGSDGVAIELRPFHAWDRACRGAVAEAAERYAAFLASKLSKLTTV
jgi:hypothetical protein